MKVPNAAAFSVAGVCYGAGVGFMCGYLWTRLRMRLYLEASDRLAADASRARGLAMNLRKQNEAFSLSEPGRDLDRAAENAVQARKAVGQGSIAPILWVDDVPDNNKALIDSLRSIDIALEIARSTTEALGAVNRRSYGLIISDLGRKEGDNYNPTAGLDLIRAIRAKDKTVPIFTTGTQRAVDMQDELLCEGSTLVTNRASVLLEEAT